MNKKIITTLSAFLISTYVSVGFAKNVPMLTKAYVDDSSYLEQFTDYVARKIVPPISRHAPEFVSKHTMQLLAAPEVVADVYYNYDEGFVSVGITNRSYFNDPIEITKIEAGKYFTIDVATDGALLYYAGAAGSSIVELPVVVNADDVLKVILKPEFCSDLINDEELFDDVIKVTFEFRGKIREKSIILKGVCLSEIRKKEARRRAAKGKKAKRGA